MQQLFTDQVNIGELPVAYFTLDKNGVFISVNELWCNLTEYSKGDVEGVFFGDLLPDNQKNIFPKTYREFRSKLGSDFRTYSYWAHSSRIGRLVRSASRIVLSSKSVMPITCSTS